MSLTLVTGPAGSGKAGEVLDRFTAALDRDPVLVTPTYADVERLEVELLARRPVSVGGRIVTFERLFQIAAGAAGGVSAPALTRVQREAVVADVARRARLEALAESARRRGFARALDSFFGEVRAARIAPGDLSANLGSIARSRGDRAHLSEVAGLYTAYRSRLGDLDRADGHDVAGGAIDGLERDPATWGDRPVFVHGFDDLTEEELALVAALARATDVVVSVVYERDRACLVARSRLLARLESLGGLLEEALPPHAGSSLLSHLERSFLVDGAERREPDGGLVLLDAAGARNEVEQVAAEIARLLRDGVEPGAIAVIARSPEAHAGLIEQVFDAYGIPAAIDAPLPLSHTSLGRALAAIVRAALVTRSAGDVVAYLRYPGRAGSEDQVDQLERAVRVDRLSSAEEASARWAERGSRRIWELEALREANADGPAALMRALGRLARNLFERPHARTAPRVPSAERADQLAAEQAARALDDIADLCDRDPDLAPDAASVVELVERLEIRRFTGSTAGRVEVMSPYRARARQYQHVFVVSLQEGEFPRRGREDPFLGEPERAAAGLPERVDQRDEERYLFYVCLSRATRRLYLSFRTADDDGQGLTRSFFVDDVLELLTEGAAETIVRGKRLSDTVFDPARAPTERELARSLAARRALAPPDGLGAAPALVARLEPLLRRARARADHLPGRLRVDAVRRAFAERDTFGASSLELYAECPFRYFVDHELRPRGLEPERDARARGSAMHKVLERLYRESDPPTTATLGESVARAKDLLAEEVAGTGLEPSTPAARVVYRRMEADLARFLAYDAAHPIGLDLYAVEATFGEEEGAARGPLRLDGVSLHGQIDRIDGAPGGSGFIRDYKSGKAVASRAHMDANRKLQIPLYLVALRELWGIDPIGGVYHPLGQPDPQEPRGLLRRPPDRAAVADPAHFKRTDFTATEEEFEETLEVAKTRALEIAGKLRGGHLGREPLGGSCPRYCDFHPICRRERGQKNPEENGPAEAGGDD